MSVPLRQFDRLRPLRVGREAMALDESAQYPDAVSLHSERIVGDSDTGPKRPSRKYR
jgi:hypothetical protein